MVFRYISLQYSLTFSLSSFLNICPSMLVPILFSEKIILLFATWSTDFCILNKNDAAVIQWMKTFLAFTRWNFVHCIYIKRIIQISWFIGYLRVFNVSLEKLFIGLLDQLRLFLTCDVETRHYKIDLLLRQCSFMVTKWLTCQSSLE